jgi:succinate dehydrogenase/fumarate reductase flavoprotein subunit
VFTPLMRNSSLAPSEFENVVRIITTDHFGPYKSEVSLTSAIGKLDALDHYRNDLKANNFHELMRCHEAMNIHSVAKIVAHAALARKESRFIPYHYRSDHPETDDEWCGLVAVRKDGDSGVATRFERLHYHS